MVADKLNGKNKLERARSSSSAEVERFAERLKQAIGNRSARSFARDAGLSETALRKYLSGESTPNVERLAAIAKAAGVNVEWLATGTGSPHARDPKALMRDFQEHMKREKLARKLPDGMIIREWEDANGVSLMEIVNAVKEEESAQYAAESRLTSPPGRSPIDKTQASAVIEEMVSIGALKDAWRLPILQFIDAYNAAIADPTPNAAKRATLRLLHDTYTTQLATVDLQLTGPEPPPEGLYTFREHLSKRLAEVDAALADLEHDASQTN